MLKINKLVKNFLPLLEKKRNQQSADSSFCLIGVTRFELAASASLRRRSNQTEPHPVDTIVIILGFKNKIKP